jgi:hypothetical protein
MSPAVLRQQMGHSAAGMTARHTGEIVSNKSGLHFARAMAPIMVLENGKLLENGHAVRNVASLCIIGQPER